MISARLLNRHHDAVDEAFFQHVLISSAAHLNRICATYLVYDITVVTVGYRNDVKLSFMPIIRLVDESEITGANVEHRT